MIEAGYEVDTPGRSDGTRWWYFIEIESGRMQAPRQGVVDRGFRFARGGRANSINEARSQLINAAHTAQNEWRLHHFQPSHMLGPMGQLIPLDEVPAELAAAPPVLA